MRPYKLMNLLPVIPSLRSGRRLSIAKNLLIPMLCLPVLLQTGVGMLISDCLYVGQAFRLAYAAERKEIVVVMPMAAQNLSPEVRSSLTESFIGELIRSDKYDIVSGKIVADAMTEAFKKQKEKKQQCDELACVREVAGNFGADLVLTIKVVKDEDVYLLNAKIENITSGSQVALKDDSCEKCKILELQKKVKLLAARLMGLDSGEAAPAIAVKKPAAEEPRGGSFSLEDLEKKAQEEAKQKEVEKAKWNEKTRKMQEAFNKVMEYQKKNVSPDLKISAWKRFLETFTEENPYSQEDDTMRGKAREQISYWENPTVQKQEIPTQSVYTDNRDGTVTANKTGLMWQKNDDGERRNWKDSVAYCDGLTLAGYSDWRLPSKDELETLIDKSSSPTIDRTYFPNTSLFHYWASATNLNGISYAWSLHFGNGVFGHIPSNNYYVRCVRGGQ